MPEWKQAALADPNLPEGDWQVLKLGPTTLADWIHLQLIKFKYQIRGISD